MSLMRGDEKCQISAIRVDLQYIKLPSLAFANYVDAEQCAFRKCLMNSLAKRDDFRIIAD